MSARKRDRASISVSRIINKRIRYDPAQANRQRAADNAKRLRRYQSIIKHTITDDAEHTHHDDVGHLRAHDDEIQTKSQSALTTAFVAAGGGGVAYRRRVSVDGGGGGDGGGEGGIDADLFRSARRVDISAAESTDLAAAAAPAESFAAARRRRAISHSRYSARTSRGQPMMRGRIFEMLKKIQSKHDNDGRRREQANARRHDVRTPIRRRHETPRDENSTAE